MGKTRSAVRKAKAGSAERVTVINLKGTPELRDWLNGISKRTLIPAAAIARDALQLWAEEKGHPAPPPL